jgi:hypothetical protein
VVDVRPEPLAERLLDRALGHPAEEQRPAQLDPLGDLVGRGAAAGHAAILSELNTL